MNDESAVSKKVDFLKGAVQYLLKGPGPVIPESGKCISCYSRITPMACYLVYMFRDQQNNVYFSIDGNGFAGRSLSRQVNDGNAVGSLRDRCAELVDVLETEAKDWEDDAGFFRHFHFRHAFGDELEPFRKEFESRQSQV
jgi:hypothetical protein